METAVRYKEHTDVSHIQMVVNYQCNKCCSSSCNLRINLPQTTVNFWTSVWELLGGDTLPHSRDYSISAIREQPWELVQWACDTPSQDGMLTQTHNYCTLQCMWRMTRHTLCLWLPSQTLSVTTIWSYRVVLFCDVNMCVNKSTVITWDGETSWLPA